MINKNKTKKKAKLTFTSKAKQVEKLQSQKPPKKSISKKKTNNDKLNNQSPFKSLYLRGIMEIHPTLKERDGDEVHSKGKEKMWKRCDRGDAPPAAAK